MRYRTFRVALLGCAVAVGARAFAEPRTITLDEDMSRVWAKVAKHRAKANASKAFGSFDDEDGRCGSVDIGNVSTGGSRRGAPREVVTVVTGDVINAPGRCK